MASAARSPRSRTSCASCTLGSGGSALCGTTGARSSAPPRDSMTASGPVPRPCATIASAGCASSWRKSGARCGEAQLDHLRRHRNDLRHRAEHGAERVAAGGQNGGAQADARPPPHRSRRRRPAGRCKRARRSRRPSGSPAPARSAPPHRSGRAPARWRRATPRRAHRSARDRDRAGGARRRSRSRPAGDRCPPAAACIPASAGGKHRGADRLAQGGGHEHGVSLADRPRFRQAPPPGRIPPAAHSAAPAPNRRSAAPDDRASAAASACRARDRARTGCWRSAHRWRGSSSIRRRPPPPHPPG